MAKDSKIQWTDATWNIARGCSKVDADCKYCYMYRQSLNGTRYLPDQVIRTKGVFNMPLRLKEPSKIFTSSLTDFFHEDIDSYRHEAWDIIRKCPQHTFQILTKRPERITQSLPKDWGDGWPNVWLGTSVGHSSGNKRIKQLIQVTAKVKFLSLEPLYGPISLEDIWIECPTCEGTQSLPIEENGEITGGRSCPKCLIPYQGVISGIDWVIVGGESGNENGKYKYRECRLEWIEQIVRECRYSQIPVFVKQMGTHLAKTLKMKDRHGGDIEEFPEHLKVRHFPI